MKIIEGMYQKPDTNGRKIKVLVLENGSDNVKGLDLTLLSEEDQNKAIELRMEYEKSLNSFMKSYRNFKKEYIKENSNG